MGDASGSIVARAVVHELRTTGMREEVAGGTGLSIVQ